MSVRWTQGECRAGTSSSAPGKGEEGLMDGAGLYHGTSEVKLDGRVQVSKDLKQLGL